jgi:hypothetical protein
LLALWELGVQLLDKSLKKLIEESWSVLALQRLQRKGRDHG